MLIEQLMFSGPVYHSIADAKKKKMIKYACWTTICIQREKYGARVMDHTAHQVLALM